MVQDAKRKALNALTRDGIADHIAERLCVRKAEAQIKQELRRASNLVKDNANGPIVLKVDSPYHAEVKRFTTLLNAEDLYAIVARYPVRSSGLPRAIATALQHPNTDCYQQAMIARIPGNAALANSLRQKIEPLAQATREHPVA